MLMGLEKGGGFEFEMFIESNPSIEVCREL